MAAILGMAAVLAWAVSAERISYVVTGGVSMQPTYHAGDLVIVIKTNDYEVGQIAAYHGSSAGIKVLHRIIGGTSAGFVFQGDNNAAADAPTPAAGELIGRAVLHVPKGGTWLQPILSPTGLGMLIFLIMGSGAAAGRTRREVPRGRRKKRVTAMARQANSWATVTAVARAVGRLPVPLRAAAILVGVTTVFALTLGVLGWMKPAVEQRTAAGVPQVMTFSYSARVPRSPAYDSTTATAPDPIFRRLANRVDVQMTYAGPAGTFDAFATLADNSGWHTVVPLAPARRFSGDNLRSSVTIDLDSFDARAKAAAAAIGVQPGTLALTINARVRQNGAAPFTAPLALVLAPLHLTLADGRDSLVVTNAATRTPADLVARTIGLPGHPLMTASRARSLAILLLLGAAAGATAFFVLGRRGAAVRTRADIERRFAHLLVHVEPMPSPPGKPVVNVDNFPALVKLAERYGQMILTWRRPDADDFVVRDEGITYRYRVPLDEVPVLHNVERIGQPSNGTHRRKASASSS